MALVTRTLTNAGAPLYSPDGDLLVGVKINFQLMDMGGRPSDAWDATTNERVGGDVIVATTDAAGVFSVPLWPNTRGNRATKYKCRVQFDGFREFSGIVEDVSGVLLWVDFMLGGAAMTAQDMSAIAAAIASHVASADPHTQYAKKVDLGTAALLNVGTTTGTVAAGDDARLVAVADKVDKITGKGLSTEDYSTAEKSKLAGIADGAEVNVNADWNAATGDALILNKPTLGTAAATSASAYATAVQGGKADTALQPAAGLAAIDSAASTKLAGIAAGANNYTHPANHPPSIITQDASNRFVADTEKSTWNAKEPAITAGTTAQYRRGDKTWQPVADLPVSTAQAAAIATATAIHPFLLIGA